MTVWISTKPPTEENIRRYIIHSVQPWWSRKREEWLSLNYKSETNSYGMLKMLGCVPLPEENQCFSYDINTRATLMEAGK